MARFGKDAFAINGISAHAALTRVGNRRQVESPGAIRASPDAVSWVVCERLLEREDQIAHWSRAPRRSGQTTSSDRCPAGNPARPLGRGTRRHLLRTRDRRICRAERRSARLCLWSGGRRRRSSRDRPRSRARVDRVRSACTVRVRRRLRSRRAHQQQPLSRPVRNEDKARARAITRVREYTDAGSARPLMAHRAS